jgi:hydroxymethylglutaryl-CoA reductase (NADPH)
MYTCVITSNPVVNLLNVTCSCHGSLFLKLKMNTCFQQILTRSPEIVLQSKVNKTLPNRTTSFSQGCESPSKQLSLSHGDLSHLSNEQVAALYDKSIKDHQLEKIFGGLRAVEIRRLVLAQKLNSLNDGQGNSLNNLPYVPEVANWYDRIHGANCEIVTGFVTIPVGVAGPLLLNDELVYIPMATTEGCLVASTNRGCKAISTGGVGAASTILRDGITRAPCLQFSSARRAAQAKLWIEDSANMLKLKSAFESTTSFGKLIGIAPTVAGKNVYLRLKCFSGDAMGMNMVSKGSLAVVEVLKTVFEDLSLVALSGNTCTDKKSAAINWIEGRGKSVVVETLISKEVVKSILKTSVEALVSVNTNKNLIGSAMAGSIGGFNAHAANMVTAIFLATGQDPAQNVESSSCITLLEETSEGHLWMSCTMPSIEVGTVGGGTSLPAQSACLDIIGCKGGGNEPGENAQKLAHVVAGAVMAGELSLLAALAANTLVQAHMQHNRKSATSCN